MLENSVAGPGTARAESRQEVRCHKKQKADNPRFGGKRRTKKELQAVSQDDEKSSFDPLQEHNKVNRM